MSVGVIFLAAVFIAVAHKRNETTNNDDDDNRSNETNTDYLPVGETASTAHLHLYETPFEAETMNNHDIPNIGQFLDPDITVSPYFNIKSTDDEDGQNTISPFYDNAGM